MSFTKTTADYEVWLGEHLPLVAADLKSKHEKMASVNSAFPFFRATFYRWAQQFPKRCPDLADAPALLAVGDLHVQNFGTWRDAEGRLSWGVNDLDEAFVLPYTGDLVRLAASAVLQGREQGWGQSPQDVCNSILAGYSGSLRARLEGRARPTLLEELPWLASLRPGAHPGRYWRHLKDLPASTEPVPHGAMAAIKSVLPAPEIECRVTPRCAGMGSLGRPRYCAVADWRGGPIAREAKATAPSACAWLAGSSDHTDLITKLLDGAVRAPDPAFRVRNGWIVRRLAPDCDKIDDAVHERDLRTLRLMGAETANVHVGERDALRDAAKDLKSRPGKWLRRAVKEMLQSVQSDWEEWRARPERTQPTPPQPAE
jgi:hypothetical protein